MIKYSYNFFYLFVFLSLLITLNSCNKTINYSKYVNPFIGTQGTGHTFPGATYPMGLVQLSPQTGNGSWEYCSGYQYKDSTLIGFGHTHLNGTGNADMGDILVLPVRKGTAKKKMAVPFSKTKERASPGYYSTVLLQDDILVELTASAHSGIHRYTFNKTGAFQLIINIDHLLAYSPEPGTRIINAQFEIESDTRINGFLSSKEWVERKVYFTIELSKPFKNKAFMPNEKERVLLLDYDMEASDNIEMKISLSTVSIEGAKENFNAEVAHKSFEQINDEGVTVWNDYLGVIDVKGDKLRKEKLYSALYRMYIQPNNIADVTGEYRGANDSVATSVNGAYYSTFSLWDTYRAAHPLYTIISPKVNTKFVASMLAHEEAKGYLPVWTLWGKENWGMIGNHSISVIADAYMKGLLSDEQGARAFDAVKRTLTTSNGKYNWEVYDKYGYLPYDINKWGQSVSMTLEATFDDWCAAQMAKKLGRLEDYNFFSKRANYYKNLYDEDGFAHPRATDSAFIKPFSPYEHNQFTEGNSWQYSWHVLHDIGGLVDIMGGKKRFGQRLDSLFNKTNTSKQSHVDVTGLIGQYAHGNEPSHHVIYLYNYAGEPHKAQKLIREVQETQYLNSPDGLSGNEDCGQMGAWHVFSALGFYPVNPASGKYDLGVPSFIESRVKVGDSEFVIKAPHLSDKNSYVKVIKLNGEILNRHYITHKEIMAGGELEFVMTNTY